jgi:hypothetical protein
MAAEDLLEATTAETVAACRDACRALARDGTIPEPCWRALAAAVDGAVARAGRRATTAAAGRPYERRVLYQAPDVGVVLLGRWAPGGAAAPHDHGGGRGEVRVLCGRFEERVFAGAPARGAATTGEVAERAGGPPRPAVEDAEGAPVALHPVAARSLRPGSVLRVGAATVHDMRCVSGRGITLHVYVGADERLRVFDLATGRVHLVRGGAWLPRGRAGDEA